MADNRNMFSRIAEELGTELYEAFKDASKSKTVPYGMQVATSQAQRDQAWRNRVVSEKEFALSEFRKDKASFRRRWEHGKR
jgi:hypothetical protein